MQLTHDEEFERENSPAYGKYLGTFISAQGHVRADLFDDDADVTAYVSFPTGRSATNPGDRYVAILEEYAAGQGFGDRFHLVYGG